MAENKSIDGIIEKLALVADGLQTLFPEGTMAVAMELNYDNYKKVQKNLLISKNAVVLTYKMRP